MIRPFTAVLPLLLLSACSGPGAGAADARILHVLQAAGEVDRSAGLLGSETGSDSAVRALGARLAADHAAAGGAAAALARRLRLQPAENSTSARFRAEGARNREVLLRESGAEFDRVFLENEIAYHETMLRVLDDTLAVAAQSAAVRTHLAQVRAVVQAHLHEARRLQSAGAH